MSLANPGRVLRLVAALSVLVFYAARPRATESVRALSVGPALIGSTAAVNAVVEAARAGGFNALLVQTPEHSDETTVRPLSLAEPPAFDPLAATVRRAHEAGLAVHARVNVSLVTKGDTLPATREAVIYRHPEWLMVPRALGAGLAPIDPKSPEYIGRLMRYVRARSDSLEGLYVSPVQDEVASYAAGLVRSIVERYGVDGILLEGLRYPSDDFDYSRAVLAAFRRSVIAGLPASDRRAYDARIAEEPFVYVNAFPERWRAFRTDGLNRLLDAVRTASRQVKPALILSAAIVADADSSSRLLQDWGAWLTRDLVDVVCPMASTTDARILATQITSDYATAGARVWAGIGTFGLSSAQIVEHVQAVRRAGVTGIVLFSPDTLAEPARGPEYLSQVGRAAFVQ